MEKRNLMILNLNKRAEENSNRETGRKFSVDESMVRRWRETMADVDEGSPKQCNLFSYKCDFYSRAASIQGRLAAFIRGRFLFKGGFYSRKYGRYKKLIHVINK